MKTLKELLVSGASCTGYDIGEFGAICSNRDGNIFVLPMPKTAQKEWELFTVQANHRVYAENIHAFGGQGAVSTGSLMQRKGRLEGMALADGRKMVWVNPLTWIECYTLQRSKHFASKTLWKRHLAEIASKLAGFPIKKDHADAFLIWYYGMHVELGVSLTKYVPKFT